MDFTNVYHRALLHYGIAAVSAMAVMMGLVPDLGVSCLVALIGWFAFCMAGYLSLCHDEQTFDRPLSSRLKLR